MGNTEPVITNVRSAKIYTLISRDEINQISKTQAASSSITLILPSKIHAAASRNKNVKGKIRPTTDHEGGVEV
jgi:hypothetical protein